APSRAAIAGEGRTDTDRRDPRAARSAPQLAEPRRRHATAQRSPAPAARGHAPEPGRSAVSEQGLYRGRSGRGRDPGAGAASGRLPAVAPAPARGSSVAASQAPWADAGTAAVRSRLAGIFFLLNVALFLELYGDFTS